jgi:class 3 adenylate cyclase
MADRNGRQEGAELAPTKLAADHAGVFTPYVPPSVRAALPAGPLERPGAVELSGAVLFVDLSGFSQISEQLSSQPGGAERLKAILDRYFELLNTIVAAHGGEVMSYAGDGCVALWRSTRRGELEAPLRDASSCARDLRAQLDGLRVPGTSSPLRVHQHLACGGLWIAWIGGLEDHWHYLLAGEPLEEIAGAPSGAPGEIVLLPSARERSPRRVGPQRASAASRAPEVVSASAPREDHPGSGERGSNLDAVRSFVPPVVRSRVAAGLDDWLAEFRLATVLFAGIRGLTCTTAAGLERLDEVARRCQEVIHRYGGSVHQFAIDDKGTVVLAGWGLPLHAHDDDAHRAVRAGLDLERALASLGVSVRAGIATGQIFVGHSGSSKRRDFAMIGATVNRAAHLMGAASSLLCDATTRARVGAGATLAFEALPPLRLKGTPGAVPVSRPFEPRFEERRAMVGRRRELAELLELLAAVERGSGSALALIEGEPGIGKSLLVRELIDDVQGGETRVALVTADALETSPLGAWRKTVLRLLGMERLAAEDRVQRLCTLLGAPHGTLLGASHGDLNEEAGVVERVPALSSLLGLGLEESAATLRMSGEGRAAATQQLLASAIGRAVGNAPLLLIVDDAQWLDSASWTFTEHLFSGRERCFLVIATRPLPETHSPPELARLLSQGARRLKLGVLSQDDARRLLQRQLGGAEIDETLLALLSRRAEGHPFYVKELALALREQGLLDEAAGRCALAGGAAGALELELPGTIQGVVSGRIDRLSAEDQLTIKVASVLGRHFSLADLAGLHPLGTPRQELIAQLEGMSQVELMAADAENNEGYGFRHSIIQEVAYGQLTLEQRRRLHRSAAERSTVAAIERKEERVSHLAHHWERAGAAPEALRYLEEVADIALRAGAYREAIDAIERCERIAAGDSPYALPEARAPQVDAPQRAGWERRLGQALEGRGDLERARAVLESALTRLGEPMPRTEGGQTRALAGELIAHCWRRWVLARRRDGARARAASDRAAPICAVLQRLNYIYPRLFAEKEYFLAILRSYRHAQDLGAPSLLLEGARALHYLSSILGSERLARGYRVEAQKICEEMGDGPETGGLHLTLGLTDLVMGRLGEADRHAALARSNLERFAERRAWNFAVGLQLASQLLRGELAPALEATEEFRSAAVADGNLAQQAQAECCRAIVLLYCARAQEAMVALSEARELIEQITEPDAKLQFYGLEAWTWSQLEQPEPCQASARAAAESIARSRSRGGNASSYAGRLGLALARLWLWERNFSSGSSARELRACRQEAWNAVRALQAFSRALPFARPGSLLATGLAAGLDGKERKSLDSLRMAAKEAERLGMPYEELLARARLVNRLGEGRLDEDRTSEEGERASHRRRTRELAARFR